MNSDWHIVPSSMTGLWAIGLALAAWLFIIWISARRKEKKSVNRPLAMAYTTTLSALAILSILLLYLGPKFPQVIKGKPLVIRTHHYQADDIDSLQSVYKELVILDYPAEGWRLWDSTTFAGINQVVVVGDGPAKDSWDRLRKSGLPVTFLPGAVPQGIVEMVYKQQINPGEEWIVKGEIIPNSHKNNKVILEGVGGILDSARVGTDGFFEFKLQPRVSGNYLFTVKALKDDGLLMDAVTIPLAIDTVRNLQIFMGTSWPHFDFNSLRNQLAERGHTVYVRNRVSRNKFQTSSINAKKAEINLLDEDFIKLIDLFIFQYSEWINLSETTHQHIKHLVAEKGIGLLLWVDQPIQRMAWPGDQITLNPTREKPDLYNTIHERGIPYRIGGKGYYPFGRGDGLENIGGFQEHGRGRVGWLNVDGIYSLLLKGMQEEYNGLLFRIVGALARRAELLVIGYPPGWGGGEKETIKMFVPAAFNRMDDWHLNIQKPDSTLYTAVAVQSPYLPNSYEVPYLPDQPGWHKLSVIPDGQHTDRIGSRYFYVGDSSQSPLKRTQRIIRSRLAVQRITTMSNPPTDLTVRAALVSTWWWVLLFMGSVIGLWIREAMIQD